MPLVILSILAGCDVPPVTPEQAADRCEARARATQGPTGGVTIGANNRTGGFANAEIGISSDFLRGDDPLQVYQACVFQLTGQMPVRPPVLRDL
jgi:hypothetical protein